MKSPFIALIGLYCAPALGAAQFTAVASGRWDSASTWSAHGTAVPGQSDAITIPSGLNVTIGSAGHALIVTIKAGGSLTINGGTLTVNQFGTLNNGGTVTVTSPIPSGAGPQPSPAKIENSGKINCTGAITLNGGVLDNTATAALNLSTAASSIAVNNVTAQPDSSATIYYKGEIDNAGQIISAGAITVAGGIVSNTRGGRISLSTSTATLTSSGTLTNHAGAKISNAGQIWNNAVVYPQYAGNIYNAGTIVNSGGTINIASSYLYNYVVSPSGRFTSGNVRYNPGTISGGALTIGVPNQTGALVGIANPLGAKISKCAITNNTSGMIYNTPGIGMLSGAGGTIDDGVVGSKAGPAITNNGSIYNGGTMIVSSLVNNAGITNASATGIIKLADSASVTSNLTNAAGGTIQNNSGATITIPVGSKGTITNNGTIANGGTIHGDTSSQFTGTPAPFGTITGAQPQFP